MSNDEKLKLKHNELKNKDYRELSIIRNTIFWVANTNDGHNKNNAIFAKPFDQKDAIPQQLTSCKHHIKSNFHGYGGKSYKCVEFKNKIYLIWIDQCSKAIWLQIFVNEQIIEKDINKYLLAIEKPKQLSKSLEANFDSSFVITEKNLLYGICEIKRRDYLFSLDLEKTNQDIHKIKKFDNFAGNLSSNSSANLVSWIEWDTPYMPWEKNNLFFAEINIHGEIKTINKFSNKLLNTKINVSFFQPYWISENILLCSEDSSGWWNLLFIDVSQIEQIVIKKRIKREFYEYGSPQWMSGISFFSGSIEDLFCLAKHENNWVLEQYQDLKFIKQLILPFSSVRDICAFDKKVVLKGYGSNFLGYLFEKDFAKTITSKSLQGISFNVIHQCSKPESFWFRGFNNQPTHAFIYKPIVKSYGKPPLLIRAHSGPTAYFDGTYNPEVQHWLLNGCVVAEVNYGGSSGFGREYRERLNYQWGVVDSYDCKALVIELLKLDLVDSDKVIIFGNSAGGLTALNALCDDAFFKAAICKYPVIDLVDMYHNTHRFEKDYLNSLVGDYVKFPNNYYIRSPINKINNIKKPILLFHGKKDSVISYKQTLKIQEKLLRNNNHSEVIFFKNEGHGFKDLNTKKIVMKKTEEFLKKLCVFKN